MGLERGHLALGKEGSGPLSGFPSQIGVEGRLFAGMTYLLLMPKKET